MSRKIFDADNLTSSRIISSLRDPALFRNSISACGCLFYKMQDSLQLLMIEYENPKKPYLDDFGGKIDISDTSVLEAAMREVAEETNALITPDMLYPMLETGTYTTVYDSAAKYFVYLIPVDDSFFLDTSVFGKKEEGNRHIRTIQWYSYEIVKNRVSPRLRTSIQQLLHL